MKILLLSPNQIQNRNWTHQLFRNEIGNHHDVTYYGDGYPNYIPNKPISEIIKNKNFDIILTYGLKYTEPFIGIGEVTNIPKVHIAVDYCKDASSGTFERNHIMFNRDKYDLYFGVVGMVVRYLQLNEVCSKAYLLPFSIDTNIYKNLHLNKIYDVFSVFTINEKTYPNRKLLLKFLEKNKINTFSKKVIHNEYINAINKSRICLTSNNKFKSLSIKYTEYLSCGSFMMSDKPEDFDELGYVDGKHLVIYNDFNDLKSKINFYIKNESIRENIAKNGMEFVRQNHNNTIRVKQFTKIIKQQFNI